VAVCDLFDTLAWVRPGKTVRTAHWAQMFLLQSALLGGDQRLDPALARAFLETVGLYPTGSPLLLNTGEVGVVVGQGSGAFPERPVVRLVFDAQGQPALGGELDLSQDRTREVLWPLTSAPLGINPVACFRSA